MGVSLIASRAYRFTHVRKEETGRGSRAFPPNPQRDERARKGIHQSERVPIARRASEVRLGELSSSKQHREGPESYFPDRHGDREATDEGGGGQQATPFHLRVLQASEE